jgi:Uma2 family endonuclease
MNVMFEQPELIEAPLSREELVVRYRELCDDPCLTNVPGKIELDSWGRLLMTPAAIYHGLIQGRLAHKLKSALGGEVITEGPIATSVGLFVPDVAWASAGFMSAHGSEFALMRAPEICIEVVSPSNSVREMTEKRDAYLACGALEVWWVFTKSKRCEFHAPGGRMRSSAYAVDLADLFA